MYIRRTAIKSRRTGEPYYTLPVGGIGSPRGACASVHCSIWDAISMSPVSGGRCAAQFSGVTPTGIGHEARAARLQWIPTRLGDRNTHRAHGAPGSERATYGWLTEHSGLGELIGHEFAASSPMGLYRFSDQLLQHTTELERLLYGHERTLYAYILGQNNGNVYP
jgi:hypothetical protein